MLTATDDGGERRLHLRRRPERLIYQKEKRVMSTIRAHFDGKVFIPEGPVDMPVGAVATLLVPDSVKVDERPTSQGRKPLAELAALLDALPDNSQLPPDASMNVDHYLYGHPKRAE
jgi:hypothetical protein